MAQQTAFWPAIAPDTDSAFRMSPRTLTWMPALFTRQSSVP
jgi:hypothetical protein